MLFDLRGAGRRRTVKAVYVTLAVLMGGGLVLFGIGGDVSGGLFDAFQEGGGTSDDGRGRLERREKDALARTTADPSDESAWVELVRARVAVANGVGDNYNSDTGEYSAAGQAKLEAADDAYQKYLALDPDPIDEKIAQQMTIVYQALGEEEKATRAWEIVADANPDNANIHAQWAISAYLAGLNAVGDRARRKAIQLTEPDMREGLKSQIDQAKNAAASQALQDATSGGG